MENANQKSISWNMELLETKCFFVSFFISAGEGFRSFLKIAAPSGMVPTPLFFFSGKFLRKFLLSVALFQELLDKISRCAQAVKQQQTNLVRFP